MRQDGLRLRYPRPGAWLLQLPGYSLVTKRCAFGIHLAGHVTSLKTNTLIRNARTAGSLLGLADEELMRVQVVVNGQKIVRVSSSEVDRDIDRVIDAEGLFLAPGLVDPQVHFREPGTEYKEDIESGSEAAAKGGFTAVVSMPNTSPAADRPEVIQRVLRRAQEIGTCKVYPAAAVTYGLRGEELTDFESLKAAGAVAVTDDGKGVQRDDLFREALARARRVDLPVLDHSEDESLSAGGAIHKGEVSERHGVKGIDADSEAVHVERGCDFSAATGGRYHVLHISTARSIDAVRKAKAAGHRVTAEVSPHHLLLCDTDIPQQENGGLNANWKMNPPLRSKQDREACQKALLDGTIDAIATDHAPHAAHEKSRSIEEAPFGIIGLETAFPLIYTYFVKTGRVSLARCIDLMSKQAGALFGLHCGRIREGALADLTLFDLDHPFVVDEGYFASKSKNSPFIGYKLFGRTKLTMMEGKIVFDDRKVNPV